MKSEVECHIVVAADVKSVGVSETWYDQTRSEGMAGSVQRWNRNIGRPALLWGL